MPWTYFSCRSWNFLSIAWQNRQTATGIHYEKITVNLSFIRRSCVVLFFFLSFLPRCFDEFADANTNDQLTSGNNPYVMRNKLSIHQLYFSCWKFFSLPSIIINHACSHCCYYYYLLMMKSNKCLYLHEFSCYLSTNIRIIVTYSHLREFTKFHFGIYSFNGRQWITIG